ncbi:MAG: oxidoreductase [Bacillus sp. (in: firmicutes)]
MKIKTAILGFGLSGSRFHAPFIEALEEFELTAIVARNLEKVKESKPDIPVYDTIDLLLEKQPEVELIILSTPTPTHFDLAKKAIMAGKHVIVEKPFVVTEQEGEQLISLAEQYQVVLTVYQNRRWDGDFMTVKQLIDSNRLGSIHTVEMNWDRYRKEVRDRWKEANIPGGGIFYDMAPHMLDQALQLFGFPKSIYGNMQAQRDGSKTTDYYHVVLEYPFGTVLIRGGSLVSAATPRFVLHGTEGSYVAFGVDPQESQLSAGMSPNDEGFAKPDPARTSTITNPDGTQEHLDIQQGDYRTFFRQMARAIRNGEQPPVQPTDGVQIIRLIEAGIRSSEEKTIITFN